MSTGKKVPTRKCVGCGETKNKNELVRVLKTQDDEFVVDVTGKKNGRGAYICKNKECLNKAIKNKGLERSFKTPVMESVYDVIKKEFDELEK